MASKKEETTASTRAWGLTLLALVILILAQAIPAFLRSRNGSDLQMVVLIFPALFFAWRLWTQKGTVSPFEFKGLFRVEDGRFNRVYFVIWLIATLLVALMIRGALAEFFETIRAGAAAPR